LMSDCYCDYDQPEFYRAEVAKARKTHKCYECGGRNPVYAKDRP
jgi:hypothetical protein